VSVRRTITEYNGLYFITITCCKWLHLFEQANAYNSVYKWFDYLKSKGHFITGYIIMPNHLHALIAFRNTEGQSINKIIGSGKRFMAYEIIAKLKEQGNQKILDQLSAYVNAADRKKNKLHEVFEPSFDWKDCLTTEFARQKIDYIHANPCKGNWSLANQYWDYPHSSARYYATGEQGIYEVYDYARLKDVDLTKA
jgi:REP element-mobilizing transposase RayT